MSTSDSNVRVVGSGRFESLSLNGEGNEPRSIDDLLAAFFRGDVPENITVRLDSNEIPEDDWDRTDIVKGGDTLSVMTKEMASGGLKGA